MTLTVSNSEILEIPVPRDDISKVAVIGSGVMGAGIAAHCANAGCDVVLLDIVPKMQMTQTNLPKMRLHQCSKQIPKCSCTLLMLNE